LALASGQSHAQTDAKLPSTSATATTVATPNWPTQPLRLVVGFAGGSTPDLAARSLAEPLAGLLGQPVIVDNRPGASGNLAADLVAKAKDGHTLGVLINGNLTSARLLNPRLPYNPATDFAYLSLLSTAPLLLVAPANLPGGKAFFEAAPAAGTTWNYASVGVGSVGHLGLELIKTQVPGLRPLHVPYASNPQILTALLGDQVQMALIPPGLALPHIRAGKLQAIGVAGGRSTLAPDVAPLAELGVPGPGLSGVQLEVWTALVAPASMPRAHATRLGQAVQTALKRESTRQRLFAQGWQAVGTAPEGLALRVAQEAAQMGKIIRTQGISLE
jgi:tripartite-type tricarboxylate transporter receptor subunit TctC